VQKDFHPDEKLSLNLESCGVLTYPFCPPPCRQKKYCVRILKKIHTLTLKAVTYRHQAGLPNLDAFADWRESSTRLYTMREKKLE
jgi:hypothetical protein